MELILASLASLVSLVYILIPLLFPYIYFAVCLMFLAKKVQTSHMWMAWLPVLNFYLLCKIAGKSEKWFIGILLPIILPLLAILFGLIPYFPQIIVSIITLFAALSVLVAIVIWMILWREIAKKVGKPEIYGVLMLIPVVNFIIMGILAFSETLSEQVDR